MNQKVSVQKQEKHEIYSLHLLRILLSYLVVLVHYWQKVGNPKGGFFGMKEIYYVSLGGVAVSFFIFFSGLLLTRRGGETMWQFYLRRFAGIYRVYWASMLVNLFVMFVFIETLGLKDKIYENIRSVGDIFIFLSGFMAFFGKWAGSMNSPSWFIGTIISLYILYPVVFEIVRRYKIFGVSLLFGTSLAARYFLTKWQLMPTRPMDWMPLSRVFEFGLGVYLKPQIEYLKILEQNISVWVGKYFTGAYWKFVGKIFAKSILLLSAISFPLFLVHYPVLNIIDYFRTTNVYVFAGIILASTLLAHITYTLSKINVKIIFIFALAASIFALYKNEGAIYFTGYPFYLVSRDGIWCWISDPRAIYDPQTKSVVTGWVTSQGNVEVAKLKMNEGSISEKSVITLQKNFQKDDHVNPSFLLDGDLLDIFNSRHSDKDGVFVNALVLDDLSKKTVSNVVKPDEADYTYTSPFPFDNDKRIVFYRGVRRKPHFSVIDKSGKVTLTKMLIDTNSQDNETRPYVKYAQDETGDIHFTYTAGHPRETKNNAIYYSKLTKNGEILGAKGQYISDFDNLPIYVESGDPIYTPQPPEPGAMIWDIKATGTNVAIAYTRLASSIDHKYHVAKLLDGALTDYFVASGGGYISQTPANTKELETHFSGGIVMNPKDLDRVLFSKEVTCGGNKSWDIFEAKVSQGKLIRNLTNCKSSNNIRPYVVNTDGGVGVFFVSFERYVSYSDYKSVIYYIPL